MVTGGLGQGNIPHGRFHIVLKLLFLSVLFLQQLP